MLTTVAGARTFEEVIVQEILDVPNKERLLALAELLRKMEVKANHQAIRDAFKRAAQAVGLASNAHTYHMVLLALWNEQRRAEQNGTAP